MPLLDVTDAFQIDVPIGWEETSLDGHEYTLNSADDSALQIRIAVYRARGKKESAPDASAAAVRSLAKSMGVQDSDNLSVMTPAGHTPRAFASIKGDGRDLFVGFYYFKKSFVVATGTAPSDDPGGFTRVERMMWGIEAA